MKMKYTTRLAVHWNGFNVCFLHLLRILRSAAGEWKARRIDHEVTCRYTISIVTIVVTLPYRIGSITLSEHFLEKTRKRHEAYWIGTFSCKQEANPICMYVCIYVYFGHKIKILIYDKRKKESESI